MLVVYRQLSVLWVYYECTMDEKRLPTPKKNVVMFIRTCYAYILFSVLTQVPSDWSKKVWNRQVETKSWWKGTGLVNYHFYAFWRLTLQATSLHCCPKWDFWIPKTVYKPAFEARLPPYPLRATTRSTKASTMAPNLSFCHKSSHGLPTHSYTISVRSIFPVAFCGTKKCQQLRFLP